MPLNVPDATSVASKWSTRASAAGSAYSSGVKSPKKDWAASTAGAEAAYEAGVQAAIGRHAFSGGVKKAGTSRWQSRATSVGQTRFTQGVQATDAQSSMSSGIAPFLDVLRNLSTNARGPRGSAQNYTNVQMVGDALHAKKLALQGAA